MIFNNKYHLLFYLLLFGFSTTLKASDTKLIEWHFVHMQDSFGVTVDNERTRFRTTGSTNLGLTIKPESELFSILIDGLWLNRDDPFSPLINDSNGISNIAGEESFRLFHAVVNFGSDDSNWSGSIGQQVIDDNFLIIDEAATLINSAFGMALIITGNTLIPTYPVSSFGTHIRYQNEKYGAAFGIYDGNSGSQNTNPNSTRLGINDDDGIAIIGEVNRHYQISEEDYTLFKLGVWHHTGKFIDIPSGEQKRHNTALYAIVDQRFKMFKQSFGFFARISKMIESDKNQVSGAIEAGLNWYSPFKSRPDDLFSAGIIATQFSSATIYKQEQDSDAIVHHNEWALELSYIYKANDWLTIQPDLQWIKSPHNGKEDVLITGARVSVSF